MGATPSKSQVGRLSAVTNASVVEASGQQSFKWVLVYKVSSAVSEGTSQGLDADTIRDAWGSCNVHFAAIRYDVGGKPYSYYRRTKGPDGNFHGNGKKSDAEAWEKQGQKFDANELITDCWRSTQKTGAPNKLGDDFQMYSTEQDFFARSPAWTFCNYDDCDHHVGFPRDCGPSGQTSYKWHSFSGAPAGGQTDVSFYVNTCNGWSPPAIELGPVNSFGWEFIILCLFGVLLYLVPGMYLEHRKSGAKGFAALPHRAFWMNLRALVKDGIEFSRTCVSGSRPLTASQQSAAVKSEDSLGQKRSDRKNRSLIGSKASKSRKSRTSDTGGKTKKTTQMKSSKTQKSNDALHSSLIDDGDKQVDLMAQKTLQEQRDVGVHSSQQKIKVEVI